MTPQEIMLQKSDACLAEFYKLKAIFEATIKEAERQILERKVGERYEN